jgi:uncharacterized membrane protein (UPF0127 family)
VNSLRARLDTPSGSDWVRRAAWVVLAAAFLAFVVRGGSSPADPYFADERRPLAGFDEVAFIVTAANGTMAEWCALLAASDGQRAQGLMDQRDLRGYDGMIFQYDAPTEGAFWMRNTRIPLAVAFFDADGRYVSAQGMEPCPDEVDDADCPTYPAEAPFTTAIEVPRGGLGALGIGDGAVLEIGASPCP